LIIPFQSEDDADSEFNLTIKKCRKPRATAKKPVTIVKPEVKEDKGEKSEKLEEPPTTLAGTKRTYKKALSKLASDSFASPLRSPLKTTELVLPSIVEESE